MNGKPWTKEEDEFLISGSNDLNDNEISELLGRTLHSIWGRRVLLRKKGVLNNGKGKETNKMNVSYDKNNCADAARRIGVTLACVQRWCRDDVINYTDVGNGDKRARYLIEDDEITYLKGLVKEHGIRKAMRYYKKNHNKKINVSKGAIIVETNSTIPKAIIKSETVVEEHANNIERVSTIDKKMPTKKFDADDLVYRFERIQDLKEELDNLEARRNQITNELERLKNEIMENL